MTPRLFLRTLLVTTILALVLGNHPAFAQLTAELTADKAAYAYGEQMTVTFTLTNPTNEVISVPKGCPPTLTVDDFSFAYLCLPAEIYFYFNPGATRSWTFEIDPTTTGIPDFTGDHVVSVALVDYMVGTTVSAPRYLGGSIHIELKDGTPQDEVDLIRNSLNGVVQDSGTRPNGNLSEMWTISGYTPDQAVNLYQSHDAVVEIRVSTPWVNYTSVDAEAEGDVPEAFELDQNYPNPFNPSTNISFRLSAAGYVDLSVYDATGARVKTVVSGVTPAGEHQATFNADGLASGTYFYRLTAGDVTRTRTMVLLR